MFSQETALSWICAKLSILPETLEQALAQRHVYRRVFITKRGKKRGKRVLHVPPATLKSVQKKIHNHLLRPFAFPSVVHGFVREHSHLTAAREHLLHKAVTLLTIDFKNAFDSVTARQVRRALVQHLGLDPMVAYWLAELTTHRGRLPQGAPSSPLIFNLVCLNLDEKLLEYCTFRNYLYTRYTDEVAISSKEPIPEVDRMMVPEICRQMGFWIAPEKVRYQERRFGTLEITNVLMRESSLGLSNRKVIDRVRAALHRAAKDPLATPSVRGKVAWVKSVDPKKLRTRLAKPLRLLPR